MVVMVVIVVIVVVMMRTIIDNENHEHPLQIEQPSFLTKLLQDSTWGSRLRT